MLVVEVEEKPKGNWPPRKSIFCDLWYAHLLRLCICQLVLGPKIQTINENSTHGLQYI